MFEQPEGEGIRPGGFAVAEDAGDQTGHSVHHRYGRRLAAGKDEVSQGKLVVHQIFPHPFIHPFVMPADQHQPAAGSQFHGRFLTERPSLGGQEDHRPLPRFQRQRRQGPIDGFHLHDHAATPTVRSVIRHSMFPRSIRPNVVDMNLDEPFCACLADDAAGKGRGEHLGKEGKDVKTHLSSETFEKPYRHDSRRPVHLSDHVADGRQQPFFLPVVAYVYIIAPRGKDLPYPA